MNEYYVVLNTRLCGRLTYFGSNKPGKLVGALCSRRLCSELSLTSSNLRRRSARSSRSMLRQKLGALGRIPRPGRKSHSRGGLRVSYGSTTAQFPSNYSRHSQNALHRMSTGNIFVWSLRRCVGRSCNIITCPRLGSRSPFCERGKQWH